MQAWIDGIRGLTGPAGASTWDGFMASVSCRAAVDALKHGEAVEIDVPDRPAIYSN